MDTDPWHELPEGAAAGDRAPGPLPFLHRHEIGQFPYLCVQLGQLQVHAQEIAWYDGRVLIRYPLSVTDQRHFSRPLISWINRVQTTRIRREDACWNHPEDDIDWHEIEDEAIPAATPGAFGPGQR
ncbi:hypothetical protein OK351_09600 [Glutamicibacter sp. MNS18]|uniref:hypothetical protein n=1 Tax=Glutamicibacter sp. MNS18 TaxID=2989817 RepID=UPI0022366BF8|nr:hypothetical protein [Glutamicibacter sp. MNS18]MCW4465761.1 hypothetical protein [Glutamicibacter sp. MNS18]